MTKAFYVVEDRHTNRDDYRTDDHYLADMFDPEIGEKIRAMPVGADMQIELDGHTFEISRYQ